MTTDIIYHITDLSAENRRKTLLVDETPQGLIKLISEKFKKPMLSIYIKEEESDLLEEKMNSLKFKKFDIEQNYGLGSFLLTMEEVGEL